MSNERTGDANMNNKDGRVPSKCRLQENCSDLDGTQKEHERTARRADIRDGGTPLYAVLMNDKKKITELELQQGVS